MYFSEQGNVDDDATFITTLLVSFNLQSCSLIECAVCSLQMSYTAGQISAHYSSSKIRKTNLRLFRPEQGPRAVLEVD